MLVRARAGVHDGHAAAAARLEIIHQICTRFGESRYDAAHDNQVEVAAEHADGIEPRFPFGF